MHKLQTLHIADYIWYSVNMDNIPFVTPTKRKHDKIAMNTEGEQEAEEYGLYTDMNKKFCSSVTTSSGTWVSAPIAEDMPSILDGELFTVIENKEGHILARCNICLGKVVKGNKTSTGNFISHIKHCHPDHEKRMVEKRTEKYKIPPNGKQWVTFDITNDNSEDSDHSVTEGSALWTSISLAQDVPSILDGEIFAVVGNTDGLISARCTLCPNKIVKGSKTSTGNFICHIKHHHPELMKRVEEKRKGKSKPTHVRTAKNKGQTSITQTEASSAINDYIVDAMLPLSTVEQPEFDMLVRRLSGGNVPVPSVQSFKDSLKQQHTMLLDKMKRVLSSQDYICTTADIWSSRNKSYLGMTCHFILRDTLERQSLVLMCRRFKYPHTNDKIATSIHKAHEEFGITNKVTHIVTDGATILGKVFHAFRNSDYQSNNIVNAANKGSDSDEDDKVEQYEEVEVLGFDLVNDPDQQCIHEGGVSLPLQLRCNFHKLNLIANRDISQIEETMFVKNNEAVFGKVTMLWNKLSRSTKYADQAKRICREKIPVPIESKLNSMYSCTVKLLEQKDKLDELCTKLELPNFEILDLDFLQDWTKVIGPIATTLNILEGEEQCVLGIVLPTVCVLKKKLKQLENTKIKFCVSLLSAINRATEKCFQDILQFKSLESMGYAFASISHPRFKLKWVPTELKDFLKKKFIEECKGQEANLAALSNEVTTDGRDSNTTSTPGNDFFADLDSDAEGADEKQESMNQASMEVLNYLADKSQELTMLNKYQLVKETFLKYNTALSSSASVKRAFSQREIILTPCRNHLTDKTFEMLLLLKQNKTIQKWL